MYQTKSNDLIVPSDLKLGELRCVGRCLTRWHWVANYSPQKSGLNCFLWQFFLHDTLPSPQVISDRESFFLPKKRNDTIYEKKKNTKRELK